MGLYKFEQSDIFYNRVKTHPQCDFLIHDGNTYYNNRAAISGSRVSNVGHVPLGYVSLYELNIDREASRDPWQASTSPAYDSGTGYRGGAPLIYPFITKDGTRVGMRTLSTSGSAAIIDHDFAQGEAISGSYPLSASISRIYIVGGILTNRSMSLHDPATRCGTIEYAQTYPGNADDNVHRAKYLGVFNGDHHKILAVDDAGTALGEDFTIDRRQRIIALKNTLDYYRYLSPHYSFTSSLVPGCNKEAQAINLINVPSIFYGSSIKKGTVDLKFYVTGTLIGRLQDQNENGELIQTEPTGSTGSGSVAGVVLYNEGFVLLTGSWNMIEAEGGSHTDANYDPETSGAESPKWLYFGATGSAATTAYRFSFKGTNYTPTATMLAHAPKGEVNHSNNPTYIKYGRNAWNALSASTNDFQFIENKEIQIKNIVKTDYADPTGSFEKITYISKIGIYDKDKNLIAIAKVARPVKKTEDRDLTFKLKLDF